MNGLRANNPMSEYLLKIELIVSNSEFKNKTEASKYETVESKMDGEMYVRAKNHTDIFESYEYSPKEIYKHLEQLGYSDQKIFQLIENPNMIPFNVKDKLLLNARQLYIDKYKEKNKYYLNLYGLPFNGDENTPPDEVIGIPDEFYEMYKTDSSIYRNEPIHLMPDKYQELFMNTEYYQQVLDEHPNVTYLKYIGTNKIPIEVSRACKDGDIMRINTNKLSMFHETFGNITVESDVIHTFLSSYKKCREYVFGTLRGNFNQIYANYDSFVRYLTIIIAIGNTLNELSRFKNVMIHENTVAANNFFTLYGLPSSVMESGALMEFLKKFRQLLQDKGTNVVYRVKDIIGYEYTDIYTLVMVKQQAFDSDGKPIWMYNEETGERTPVQKIVFRRLGVSDDNVSYFKFKNQTQEYSLEEITSGDPRWWNTPEVEKMIHDMNYTLSNSKYIQLDTHMSMNDVWWQCVVFIRGLLDRRQETNYANITINHAINGSSEVSVFDAVISLVILMNWYLTDANGKHFDGNMYLPNADGKYVDLLFNGLNDDGSPKPLVEGDEYLLSGFNFDVRYTDSEWYNSLPVCDYLEPERFIPMLNEILDMHSNNIGEVLMTSLHDLYDYLVEKLRDCVYIYQFRQVTDAYNKLFLIDPKRDWYDTTVFNPDVVILDEYGISEYDYSSLKSYKFEESDFIKVNYNNTTYTIDPHEILNVDVTNIAIFNDDEFVSVFSNTILNGWTAKFLEESSISDGIKANYQKIINDKVLLDVGNTDEGPKTFDSLLFRHNPPLYRYLYSIKNEPVSIVALMRNIIRGLESYSNSKLSALEFKALGMGSYFDILKEVITYFKSYMVEFSSEEISIVFDGLFDYGGNSNMINLYDEINSIETEVLPKDSLTLHDVAFLHGDTMVHDTFALHDEMIIRYETTFQNVKNTGYELWYDYNGKISRTPWDIPDDRKVNFTIIKDESITRVIIDCNSFTDIDPPNFIGHN
jgi:hypothetical protein